MKTFDELWQDILERCERFQFPLVQDKEELRHIFNLMQGCSSYLEVGAAEGNSLYVLSHALEGAYKNIFLVDIGESHTEIPRKEVIELIKPEIFRLKEIRGNSHSKDVLIDTQQDYKGLWSFDCVLIDAGHEYEDVIADAIAYGHLATKYIFFHDIQLPPVKAAFDWYCRQNPQMKASTFINSTNYGYGILEV